MAVDFKTNRIRTYAIVASGSLANSPGIWIQGSGSATDFTGGSSLSLLSNVGNDTFLFVSGGIGQKGIASTKSVSVFGGDLVSSGTLHALNGITGSLTRLSDGTSYLRAGSNVTITTGSNGAITIASTSGGGGTPGGSDTQVQFNDGGSSFGGDAGLTYNKTTDTLNATIVTSSLGFSGSLTRLTDGSSYLREGTNITIASSSNGAILIVPILSR